MGPPLPATMGSLTGSQTRRTFWVLLASNQCIALRPTFIWENEWWGFWFPRYKNLSVSVTNFSETSWPRYWPKYYFFSNIFFYTGRKKHQVRLLLSPTLILAIHTSAVSTNNSIQIQYKYNTKTIQRQIQKKTNTIQAQTQYKYKYITEANIVQLSLMCNPHHCPPTIQSLHGIQTLLICWLLFILSSCHPIILHIAI